ncbi:hypothetical protein SAMN04487989_104221 [Bizionia echini]|uniref:Cell division protein ZapB n=1 Tax=Bizionia echini TaxID=649333 RepID=A0A1I5C5R1_9FLAO|nr:hypothetical protein [Bizionia echini]SFN82267.1 hypothetical protein SAMN04487989_104221 [Bizionia echini]|tara:strand:- start:233 stop:523 length:291 start_codon:yes stop_codon:yes gene_type:complete
MSKIEETVNALENKINQVLHKQRLLKEANIKLQKELQSSQQILHSQKAEIVKWEEKYEALKMANSMLGSDENKRETKLKINALIREIDHCIAQLSE